jgi:hypothetical protein
MDMPELLLENGRWQPAVHDYDDHGDRKEEKVAGAEGGWSGAAM